jgi:hypothetical protein
VAFAANVSAREPSGTISPKGPPSNARPWVMVVYLLTDALGVQECIFSR